MDEKMYGAVDSLIEQLELGAYIPVAKKLELRREIVKCITDNVNGLSRYNSNRTVYIVPKEESTKPPRDDNTIVIGYENTEELVELFKASLRMQPNSIRFFQHFNE